MPRVFVSSVVEAAAEKVWASSLGAKNPENRLYFGEYLQKYWSQEN
jgi:hypothetical protein